MKVMDSCGAKAAAQPHTTAASGVDSSCDASTAGLSVLGARSVPLNRSAAPPHPPPHQLPRRAPLVTDGMCARVMCRPVTPLRCAAGVCVSRAQVLGSKRQIEAVAVGGLGSLRYSGLLMDAWTIPR